MCGDSPAPPLIATWNPARGVWETQRVALCGHSEPYSEIWPTCGMTRAGAAYELPTLGPHIPATAFSSPPGLLPTPEAKLAHSGPDYARMSRAESGGDDLTTALWRLLPTPAARDAGRGKGHTHERGRPLSETVHQLLPTPQAREGDNSARGMSATSAAKRYGQGKRNLDDAIALLTGESTSQLFADGNES